MIGIEIAKMRRNVDALVTIDNAKGYFETSEKFTYCLDLLDLSLVIDGDKFCAYWIEQLEKEFDDLTIC